MTTIILEKASGATTLAIPVKKVDQSKEILPDPILSEILKTGLVIVGGKGTGKSIAGKVITAEIIQKQPLPIQCKIIDTALNWRWQFEPILFQEITERTRFIYSGKEHILYDTEFIDEDELMKFITKIVVNDYWKQRKLKKELEGNLFNWMLYTLEETQSSMSRFALMRKGGRVMLKMISEGRNFNQLFIIIGQRLANMSTALVERCHGMLFGKMVGDNDLAKIRRKCGRDSGIDDEVKKLADFGEFIYWNGSSAYKFNCPEYNNETRPIEWVMKEEDKKIWEHFYGRHII